MRRSRYQLTDKAVETPNETRPEIQITTVSEAGVFYKKTDKNSWENSHLMIFHNTQGNSSIAVLSPETRPHEH